MGSVKCHGPHQMHRTQANSTRSGLPWGKGFSSVGTVSKFVRPIAYLVLAAAHNHGAEKALIADHAAVFLVQANNRKPGCTRLWCILQPQPFALAHLKARYFFGAFNSKLKL